VAWSSFSWQVATIGGPALGGLLYALGPAVVYGATALALMAAARQLNLATFKDALFETSRTTAMIFLLLIGASIFTGFTAVSGLPQKLSQAIANANLSVGGVLLIVSLVYIFLGCFLDSISMMLLTVPVLLPILTQLKVNLIWFGIIIVKLVEIGCITPPFGITVYVVKGVVGKTIPLEEIFRGIWWFLIMELLTLLLLIWFPEISLILPNTMLGKG
jgi:TRAP-type C4-dicarboxylate transport system permease large subunit